MDDKIEYAEMNLDNYCETNGIIYVCSFNPFAHMRCYIFRKGFVELPDIEVDTTIYTDEQQIFLYLYDKIKDSELIAEEND